MPVVIHPLRERGAIHLRLVLGFCYASLYWCPWAQAQRSLASFGPSAEITLGFRPICMAVNPRRPPLRPQIVVLPQNQNALCFYSLTDAGALVEDGATQLSKAQRWVIREDIDHDGESEYVMLSAEGRELSVLKKSGPRFEEQRIPIDAEPRRCIVTDINNDGHKDILFFGKSIAGVPSLLGKGRGRFIPGPTLFPEYSVSDLAATDLNADGITDVLLLDWVKNKLVVFFGISGAIFSEQVTIELPAEPADLALAQVGKGRRVRVAVTLPEAKKVEVLSGNAAGEFDLDQEIRCPGRPLGAAFARLNDDPLPDIVAMTDRGMVVALATSPVEFGPPTIFGIARGDAAWQVADIDGDGRNDVAIAMRASRKLVVVANAERDRRVQWPDRYPVGESPRGLICGDFNADGETDIAVANALSGSVSILFNSGHGRMLGQIAVPVPDYPVALAAVSGPRGHGTLIVAAHPRPEILSVVRLAPDVSQSTHIEVPTATNPHILRAGINPSTNTLDIVVRCGWARSASVSLSFFEQLAGGQFLERRILPSLPAKISALAVGDFTGGKRTDLLFVVNDRTSGRGSVSIAPAVPDAGYKDVRSLFSYSDSLAATSTLLPADLDGDGVTDVVIVLAAPENSLGLALGRGDGTFRDTIDWIRGVSPVHPDELLIRDVDHDGLADITFVDSLRGEVVTLYGLGGGKFALPATICQAEGVTHIAVASIKSAPSDDLVLVHRDQAVVSIQFSAFRKTAR